MQREGDRRAFKKLAERRVNNALKYIRLIGNLSNRSNYAYTKEDVSTIFAALQDGLVESNKRFNEAVASKRVFTFDN